MRKSEEIKIRVLPSVKRAVNKIADSRLTSESEIVREAVLAYLRAHGFIVEEGARTRKRVRKSNFSKLSKKESRAALRKVRAALEQEPLKEESSPPGSPKA